MKHPLSRSNSYKLIAFTSGFSLMAFELAGSRILSPVVGSSTYVWTSIIGVIIAALSLGNYLGGWLADKRGKDSDLIAILSGSAVLVSITLIANSYVLTNLSNLGGDIRLKSIIAAILLFAPASILLGSIGPYLAKMHTKTLNETGRSIATLSALNSLGGITGTFSVGFIFFSYIGSRETLVFISILLVISSLMLVSKDMLKSQTKPLVACLVISIFGLIAPGYKEDAVALIETPTSSYMVMDVEYKNIPTRVLTMGPGGYQSGISKDGNKELVFGYTKKIAESVSQFGRPGNILILGGGSFTMPDYFAQKYPESKIDAVEIDPKLKSIAEKYFQYSDPVNVEIFSEDARTYTNNVGRSYDVVITDAYSDTGIPFSLVTEEFSKSVEKLLNPDGVLLMNVIAGENAHCSQLLRSIFATFSGSMSGAAIPVVNSDLKRRQNIILAFTKTNVQWLAKLSGQSISLDGAIVVKNSIPLQHLHRRQ